MTVHANSIDTSGKAGDKVKLPEGVFGSMTNDRLTAVAVRVFLSNQRKSAAKTKTRSEVNKTTAKMYRQKGTGRARHGAYSAPIFVGGGVAHGPDGEQNYKKKMTKKQLKTALYGALSEKATNGEITILTEPDKFKGKTKTAREVVEKIRKANEKVLVVASQKQLLVRRAFTNLDKVSVATPNQLNTYLVIKNDKLLFTNEGLKEICP